MSLHQQQKSKPKVKNAKKNGKSVGANIEKEKHPLGFTKKEQEIFKLLATGSTNKEISVALSRSPRTVEHHVSNILSKMNVQNRVKAMLRLQNEPWLRP